MNIGNIPTTNQINRAKKGHMNAGKFGAMMTLFFPDLVNQLYKQGYLDKVQIKDKREVKILLTFEDVVEHVEAQLVSVCEAPDCPKQYTELDYDRGIDIYSMMNVLKPKTAMMGYQELFDYVSDNKEFHEFWFI